jgi:hypothetical protein
LKRNTGVGARGSSNQVSTLVNPVSEQDQARLIAERVAKRVSGGRPASASPARPQNGTPAREEISAIREGLHDLESKLERIESNLAAAPNRASDAPRARVIDFVSSSAPIRTQSRTSVAIETNEQTDAKPKPPPVMAATSPWLGRMPAMLSGENSQSAIRNPQFPEHPSQERFGVEEATVTELVEFFESEKKCSVEPGGKPCDHCAMCSSRGF